MKDVRTKRLLHRALTVSFPVDVAAVKKHVEGRLSQLSMDELETLIHSDEGMRMLRGPLTDMEGDPVQTPMFSEVVVAKPGRMTRLEHARVLSGGTHDVWGPARRLKKA